MLQIVQSIDFFNLTESGDAIFHENKFPFDFKNSGGQRIEQNIL